MKIDTTTRPCSEIVIKYLETGEPYESHYVLFNKINANNYISIIEYYIHILGQNNFKIQLSFLYKIIESKMEYGLVNYNGEYFNREMILELLLKYILENKDLLTPWDKYLCDYDLENLNFKILLEEFGLENSLWYAETKCEKVSDSPYQEILDSLLWN